MKVTNIGVITFPIFKSGNIPLSNLLKILHPLSNNLYLITGNEGYDFFKDDKSIHTFGVTHESGKNMFTRILKYILTQLKLSYIMMRINKKVDIWIFFFSGDGLLLPMLTAKLLRKKVILEFPSSSAIIYKYTNDNMAKPISVLSDINCKLSNHIVVSSNELLDEWNLSPYKRKVSIAYELIVDTNTFNISRNYGERPDTIGYIGRFSREKGVLNFVEAIPQILKSRPGTNFVIIGEGALEDEIRVRIKKISLTDHVKIDHWAPHDRLPMILNDLKLLIIPSYTETGPMIALEAMACGTPILGTRVGQLFTILEDGKTGFILTNNRPECIAKSAILALDFPASNIIIKNARKLIKEKYNYTIISTGYFNILKKVL